MQYATVVKQVVTTVSPNPSTGAVVCADQVQVGWLYQNNTFSPPPPPTPTPQQQIELAVEQAFANGINLTCTSTPTLNGNYSLSSNAQAYINAIMTCILSTNSFFSGSATQVYYDASGQPHTFPSVAVFKEFALAVGSFVDSVTLYALSGGGQSSIPSANITIA